MITAQPAAPHAAWAPSFAATARRHIGQQRRELRLPAFGLRGGHILLALHLCDGALRDGVGREPAGVAQFQCERLLRPVGLRKVRPHPQLRLIDLQPKEAQRAAARELGSRQRGICSATGECTGLKKQEKNASSAHLVCVSSYIFHSSVLCKVYCTTSMSPMANAASQYAR